MGLIDIERRGGSRVRSWLGRLARARVEWLSDRCRRSEERSLLEQARSGRLVCWPEGATDDPLVTIRIATRDRVELLMEHSLPSALSQTYERLEVLVVGDGCGPETDRAMRAVNDPRVRWVNLPTSGIYPTGPAARRKVAGSYPMNAARYLASGSWLAPLDDDDAFTADHVEVLLEAAIEGRHEMVYSQAEYHLGDGATRVVGSWPLRQGEISHGSVLYSTGLRFMAHSNTSWKRREPSDWNLWARMQAIGVRIGFLPVVTYLQSPGDAARSRSEPTP